VARDSKTKKDVTPPKGHRGDVSRRRRVSSDEAETLRSQRALPQSDMKKSETRVEIKPAKGRPMLTWVGKKPLRYAIAYPAQLVETFHANNRQSEIENQKSEMGLLFHGDNKDVLAYLLANGYRSKVKLIYIDPPFDSGADYVRKVNLRGGTAKLDSEGYAMGEQIQYTDIWTNDNYLQFMYERISMLKELLSLDGSFYLHCDYNKSHHLRCLLDEIFGSEYFRGEIVWQRNTAHNNPVRYGPIHDVIFYYVASESAIWNVQYLDYNSSYIENHFAEKNEQGRNFRINEVTGSGLRNGDSGLPWRGYNPSQKGRHWAIPSVLQDKYKLTGSAQQMLDKLDELGYIEWGKGNATWPRLRYFIDEMKGVPLQDIWTDIYRQTDPTFPTQKPEELLERMISASTNPDDLVLDCFLGSGTTAAVAQKLGRRWIGADINKGAIQTTIKRLQGVMQEQADLSPQPPLLKEMGSETPSPAQSGFAVYRVNDYDLQIQHNEAFNLAVEHLGMTRTKTDAFFDGTLGKKLVKIVPFNHPVTPLDLEEVKNELKNRPDEERDIVVVGLGKEYAVGAWLDEWNKLRKQGNIPNRIEVIELRSDPKYGGFFTHEPAKAKVSFKRSKDTLEITIDDFISPTILERLRQQNKDNPLFQPQVSDWRSMVDSVMIDADYDGEVFNITLADVPERKNDLVQGKYMVEAKKGATVAVKVTDMLGEEVLVIHK
jgi:DNA modification methylase